jgi:hypothetical protein
MLTQLAFSTVAILLMLPMPSKDQASQIKQLHLVLARSDHQDRCSKQAIFNFKQKMQTGMKLTQAKITGCFPLQISTL